MKKKLLVLSLLGLFFFEYTSVFSQEAEGVKKEEILLMTSKIIEGEVEKPAIIIIPKAKLFEDTVFRKTYYGDIIHDKFLKPENNKKGEQLKEFDKPRNGS